MAEPRATAARLPCIAALAFCVLLSITGSAMGAAAESRDAKRPLPVPGAFRLEASNGYTLYVIGIPSRGIHHGGVYVSARARGVGATYRAPAVASETQIQADLGELGEISVEFHRSGQAAAARCGKRTIRFDSGRYEGTIAFHGEEGFTAVDATAAEGNIDYVLAELCESGFSGSFSGGPSRGAELRVRNPALAKRWQCGSAAEPRSRRSPPGPRNTAMRSRSNAL